MSFEHYPYGRVRDALGEPLSGSPNDYPHHEGFGETMGCRWEFLCS